MVSVAGRIHLSRRAVFGPLIGALLAIGSKDTLAADGPVLKVATLDLPATDIAAFAGANIVAAAAASRFRNGRADFPLADTVRDIGTPVEPNLELLLALKPDLLLSAWPIAEDRRLSRIGPTVHIPIFAKGGDHFARNVDAVRLVAAKCATSRRADELLAHLENLLDQFSARFMQSPAKEVLLATLNNDGSTVRVYGPSSILGSTLSRVGIANVWRGPDSIWGWSNIRPELLRQWPDVQIIEITQYWDGPATMRERLVCGPVWKALPQAKVGRIVTLPPIAVLGGLWTALHFATLLAEALPKGAG